LLQDKAGCRKQLAVAYSRHQPLRPSIAEPLIGKEYRRPVRPDAVSNVEMPGQTGCGNSTLVSRLRAAVVELVGATQRIVEVAEQLAPGA
jgi:hypothetical protein